MSDNLAPIALFVYKRPVHTAQVLEALSKCRGAGESELFIYCDGPKRVEDTDAVEETRIVVKSRRWCGDVHIIESEKNKGLANSIISGVTELCGKYGKVIVLEDDLVVAPNFLVYMNEALGKYAGEKTVLQISGHMFPVDIDVEEDAVFLPFSTSWGWATWKRAWDLFDPEATGYESLNQDRNLRRRFDLNDSYPYAKMLFDQLNGRVDSWAIRWYWSFFRENGVCLFPKTSLVANIGMDGSGTHCGNEATESGVYHNKANLKSDLLLPTETSSCKLALNLICRYLKNQKRISLTKTITSFIKFYRS